MKKLIILFILMTLSSCASHMSEMGVIIPQNVQVSVNDMERAAIVKNVKSSSSRLIFLIIPFGHPNLEEVVQKALKQGNGQLLTNVKVEQSLNWFVLFGFNKLNLIADVVRLKGEGK